MKKKLLLCGVIVLVLAATSVIVKKNKVSADSSSTQNTVVEESNKSVKQVKIELKKNGYNDDELDIAYYLEKIEALKANGMKEKEIIEIIDREAEKESNEDSKCELLYKMKRGWNNLNDIEKKLYVTHPWAALGVHAASQKAAKYTYQQFYFNGLGDKTDAFRHAVWCAIMARDIGVELAKAFSDAHENGYTEEELALLVQDGNTGYAHKYMDLYNNEIGLSIGAGEYKSDEQIVELVKRQLTNIRGNGLIWLND